MAVVPPRKAARGRDQDRLIVYLRLEGTAVLSTGEYVQSASRAAVAFYKTPGTVTAALRSAAVSIHEPLRERNLLSPTRGRYVVGLVAMAAIRESILTLLLSGPMQAFLFSAEGSRHITDTLAGKGLGLSESPPYYFSQITLEPNDRLLLCGRTPSSWESALQDASPASLEATRRRLMAVTSEDLNAVLLQATEGDGVLTILRMPADDRVPSSPLEWSGALPMEAERDGPVGEGADIQPAASSFGSRQSGAISAGPDATAEAEPDRPQVHLPQPSAYGIPPERHEYDPLVEQFLPTASAPGSLPQAWTTGSGEVAKQVSSTHGTLGQRLPDLQSEGALRAAKMAAACIQAFRQVTERISQGVRVFLPRLLPGADQNPWSFSSPAMVFIAVLVPLVVVTVASAVYFRYGRSVQYEQYLVQAQDAQAQALSLTDAAAQREAWQRELFYLDRAEGYNETSETRALRAQAQQSLDGLQGIVRLKFQPVLSNGAGVQIGRLAAGENDLYLLDAERGAILHVPLSSNGFQLDTAFGCAPGSYGGYSVGPLVDIVALPTVNTINATVLGVDAAGNLLYCAPGQVAQAIPLPPPDTNWGRVKAFTLDGGNLYVLDSQSHAVWVYAGKDGAYVDRPYFFFGGQIPELDDAIDLAVNADDLYILHSDGHISTCSYSRIEAVPTRCVDPASLSNPFPAYRQIDLFSQAHFTQMMFTPAPQSALLLLDSDGQGVFRFEPRSLELGSQLRPLAGRANPLPAGSVDAMTIGPNHVLYLALQDRIYFAADTP